MNGDGIFAYKSQLLDTVQDNDGKKRNLKFTSQDKSQMEALEGKQKQGTMTQTDWVRYADLLIQF